MTGGCRPAVPVAGADPRVVQTDRGTALYVAPALRAPGDPLPRLVECAEEAVETPPPFGRAYDPNVRYCIVSAPADAQAGDRLVFKYAFPRAAGVCAARAAVARAARHQPCAARLGQRVRTLH